MGLYPYLARYRDLTEKSWMYYDLIMAMVLQQHSCLTQVGRGQVSYILLQSSSIVHVTSMKGRNSAR
jgi:hypothetical protein